MTLSGYILFSSLHF